MVNILKLIILAFLFNTEVLYADVDSDVYCNERFDFCVNYEQGFGVKPAPDNGDGRSFYDRDGFKMSVFGSNNTMMESLEDAMKLYSSDIDKVTYQKIYKNRGIASGYKSNSIVYIKILKRKEAFNILVIEYPRSLKNMYDSTVVDISTSFEPNQDPKDYGFSQYEAGDNRYVMLESDKGTCRVQYDERVNDGAFLTDCLNYITNTGSAVFCVDDINNCVTHDSVNFFLVSGKNLKNSRVSSKPPFHGTKYFNFMGGSGTGKSLDIDKNNNVIVRTHGVISTGIDYQGPYSSLPNMGYFLYGDVICLKEPSCDMLCTKLY
ncbi:MAG: hypothetical protein WBG65_00420 [Sulfurimonadaceae bacterium]